MNLVFNIKTTGNITIQLKNGKHLIGKETLTISQDFDNMLITALDRLLRKTKVDKVRLKTAEILGKTKDKALWSMILKTIRQATVL